MGEEEAGIGTTTTSFVSLSKLNLAVAGLTNDHFSGSGAACMPCSSLGGSKSKFQRKGFRIGLPGPTEMAMRHDRGPGPFQGVTGQESGHRIINLAIVNGGSGHDRIRIVSGCHYVRRDQRVLR